MKQRTLLNHLFFSLIFICLSGSLFSQTEFLTIDYLGFGNDCAPGAGCSSIAGDIGLDYDCIFSGGTSSGNLSLATFLDPVPSGDIVTEVVLTLYGTGANASPVTTFTLNGTTIESDLVGFGNLSCTVCNNRTYSLTNLSGIPGYAYSATNTLEFDVDPNNNFCAYFVDIELVHTTPLPVDLQYFDAAQKGNINSLNWQTANEIDNEGFYIERSANGKEWKNLGFTEGAGTSVNGSSYKFMDMDPIKGTNYYRLVQTDYSGDVEISQVVSVDFNLGNEIGFSVSPNPTSNGQVNVAYTSALNEDITVEVYSLTGKLMLQDNRSVVDGTNNLDFDLSGIGSGFFVMKIANRDQQFCQKLMVK